MHISIARRLTGGILLFTPLCFTVFFSLLQMTFAYPAILTAPAGSILQTFIQGGLPLQVSWYGFLVSALLFLPLVGLVHVTLSGKGSPYLPLATIFGVVAALVQILGLSRWVFLVPFLAQTYGQAAPDSQLRESVQLVFESFHRYAGNGLGEHLGYLFTGLWTLLIVRELLRARRIPSWLGWLALPAALGILLGVLAPLGLTWTGIANQVGYTLWSLWLFTVGICFLLPERRTSVTAQAAT